mmetsp:Transcript_19224/g.21490  ORF Transcript_19224/g.21490 Transcript_19224/m.21490 type:complete len:91 (-) Transcript_19224:90-362(-)
MVERLLCGLWRLFVHETKTVQPLIVLCLWAGRRTVGQLRPPVVAVLRSLHRGGLLGRLQTRDEVEQATGDDQEHATPLDGCEQVSEHQKL